jgi:hypothetical protein
MSNVVIGCRLPSGLIIDIGPEHPTVELAGKRQAQEGLPIIILREPDCGYTSVPEEYWEAFKKRVGPDFAPIKSGAVFEAKDPKDAKAKNKELKKEKTGHEPLSQETKDVKPLNSD